VSYPVSLDKESYVFRLIKKASLSKKNVGTGKSLNEKKLKEVCSQFEAIFLGFLFKQMRKAIPESKFFEKDLAYKIYEEKLYTVLAQKLAEAGGIGLSKMLYQELTSEEKANLTK